MIAIIDYGMGNLYSVKNAFDHLGVETVITGDPDILEKADGLLLPGVGAFPDAMDCLIKTGLADKIKELCEKGTPLLGICLGMQLLLSESEEVRPTKGLDLIPGKCIKIPAEGLKIPHMGWNDISFAAPECPVIKGIDEGSYVYFVHSFMASLDDESNLIAFTDYGGKVPAMIGRGKVFGAQFHPEKSEKTGLRILKNFADFVNTEK